MIRKLAIFDIDGTLTNTNAVDDECFLRAVADVLDLELARVDWSGAPHVTDSAIVQWLSEQHRGRRVDDEEVDRFVRAFVGHLEVELERAPARFAPIEGAVDLFPSLRSAGWDVAIATGGWGPSARLKLRASRVDEPDLILACGSDAVSREEIVLLARDRASSLRGVTYSRVVSIGDATWDVRTAANLGLPFVGVGSGAREARLRAAGAPVVLADLQDRDEVLRALATAPVPTRR